jgi:hypothetical protein
MINYSSQVFITWETTQHNKQEEEKKEWAEATISSPEASSQTKKLDVSSLYYDTLDIIV